MLVVLAECAKQTTGTPSPAGRVSYVITRVFSPATWFGFLRRRRRWNKPLCSKPSSYHHVCSISFHLLPLSPLPDIDAGYVIRPAELTKEYHTHISERRGEPNGNLTFLLTLVIMHTNSYAPPPSTLFIVSSSQLFRCGCRASMLWARCPAHTTFSAYGSMMNDEFKNLESCFEFVWHIAYSTYTLQSEWYGPCYWSRSNGTNWVKAPVWATWFVFSFRLVLISCTEVELK